MTRAVELAQISSSGVSEAYKNRFINGNFDIWQRGTSTSSQGLYLADRWYISSAGSATRSTDVPNSESTFSLSITSTNNGYSTVEQYVEAENCRGFNGPVTVSLWAKSTAGSAPLIFYAQTLNTKNSSGGGVTTVANETLAVTPSTSWTKYTFTFTGNSTCETNGMRIFVFRDAVGTNTTLYSQLQIEVGSTATSFEHRPIGAELALCQRYYYRNTASSYTAYMAGFSDASNSAFVRCDLPVTMRANPTFSQSGNDLYQAGGGISIGSITNRSSRNSGSILVTTSGASGGCRLESSTNSGTTGIVEFSAEL
jgi:hypothetical protein